MCRYLSLTTLCMLLAATSWAQQIPLTNPSFEEGTGDSVPGWTLLGTGSGSREPVGMDGEHAVTVSGGDEDHNYWATPPIAFEPGGLHMLDFAARRVVKGAGAPITGTVFANVDYFGLSEEWEQKTNIFMAPDRHNPDLNVVRFGQWHDRGVIAYDAIRLWPAQAVYHREGNIVLGDGESIEGNRYVFDAPFQRHFSNHSRPLQSHHCVFNTNRMVFGRDSEAVYMHEIPGHAQTAVTIEGKLLYHVNASLAVSVSTDGATWHEVGAIGDTEMVRFGVPADLLPVERLWVRMSGTGRYAFSQDQHLGDMALIAYRYSATLDRPAGNFSGQTTYFRQTGSSAEADVRVTAFPPATPGQENNLELSVTNPTDSPIQARFSVTLAPKEGEARTTAREVSLAPGDNTVRLAYAINDIGSQRLTVSGAEGFEASTDLYVTDLFASGYGKKLPSNSGDADLWWASSGWKVSRTRAVPTEEDTALRMEMAANEAEAAQFVVRPQVPLTGVTVIPGDLVSVAGHTLPASSAEVLRVGYVHITTPTDATGGVGLWPDPLFPLDKPLDLPADENQPFWIRVTTPADTPAGLYKGSIALKGDGYSAMIPIEVRVFGFSLPDTPACRSALGLSPDWRYHGITSEEDRRTVMDAYLGSFASHRMTPYDPAPMDPFVVTWPDIKPGDPVNAADLEAVIDWSAWDKAMEQAFTKRRATSFHLPAPGMGSGTFHDRHEPDLLGYTEDTPEYKALFRSYYSKVEAHLQEKGWLDRAYIYWFDEPDPKDYAFVMNGFRKLKEAAPGIPRMLTEQVEPDLVGGPNLWCPILDAYDHDKAEERRAEGDRFGWYVCTGPKAPYPGLFIDRPATDLRVWLWQTWMYGIDGILVWTSTYWHSNSAYPDSLQDPYADPMSWVHGYGSGAGERSPWGNGDGRFLYPPQGQPGDTPDLRGPVESIRWEMLRDGIEDFDYLALLRGLLEERGENLDQGQRDTLRALLEVPEAITVGITKYTRAPEPIEARRREVAEAVELLSR